MSIIVWGFLSREVDVSMLSEDVAYSWTCGIDDHIHVIECLWVWHNCDMNLDPIRKENATNTRDAGGWTPTGVAAHDLISSEPLHIEASIYWPGCCGMHGFIRNGTYLAV